MIEVKEVDFDEIKEGWQSLEIHGHISTPFQTYEWMNIWWQHYGQKYKKLLLLAAYKVDELIGIAPLFCDTVWLKKRVRIFNVVRFIGAREIDYQNIILIPQYAEEAINAVWRYLKQNYSKYIIYLCDLPEDSIIWKVETKKYFSGSIVKKDFVCPIIVFPEKWDEYWRKLGKSTRESLNRHKNKMSKGAWVVEKYNNYSDIIADNLFNLHYIKWQMNPQNPNLFRLEKYEKDIMKFLSKKGWLRLQFLNYNGQRIAGSFMYDYHGARYFHKGGYDLRYRNFSPSTILHIEAIKDAFDNGLKSYDFLRGDETYKRYFAKNMIQCLKVILAENILKARLFEFLMK